MGALDGGIAVGIPADRDLPDHPNVAGQTGPAPGLMPRVDDLLIRLDGDQVVRERSEGFHRPPPGHRGRDRDGNLRNVPDARRVDLVVVTLPVHDLAGEQFADDLNGLAQHVVAPRDRRPALTDDVLVEVLAAAQPEGEPPVGEDLQRRRLLRDDRRVIADRRAGDVREQFDPVSGVRHGTEHRPRVGRMALGGQPRRVVVAAHLEVEARAFRRNGIADKLFWSALFCHQGVAKARHDITDTRGSGAQTATAWP